MSDLSIDREAQRRINEIEFDAELWSYIIEGKRKFQFGGPLNLISTLRTMFEKLSEEYNCDDYSTVAAMLLEVEHEADLPYLHREDVA